MVEVTLPKWGLTMEEAQIVGWCRQVGQRVAKDEVLLEVETDKATGEVLAPTDGVLVEILYEVGSVVQVGAVVARIAEG